MKDVIEILFKIFFFSFYHFLKVLFIYVEGKGQREKREKERESPKQTPH